MATAGTAENACAVPSSSSMCRVGSADAPTRVCCSNEPSLPGCNIFETGQQRPSQSQTIGTPNSTSGSGVQALDTIVESNRGCSARQDG
eukprot:6104935-Karenia_brevis.AAC.1